MKQKVPLQTEQDDREEHLQATNNITEDTLAVDDDARHDWDLWYIPFLVL